ncbi:MAG: FHA domain-containing protein [Proteobacteria bacterium]|jgi:pSer/pThr/pTyr-binding forkhead associated (FHA) protein|nr:FHA domain-containing protein [Pseudomonadota bacterium]
MSYYLEIISGPVPLGRFKVKAGYRLGRSTGEILLPDSKISALHAQIETDQNGQYFLVDRGSSNGIKVDGKKVDRLRLLQGIIFQVGKTLLRVVLETEPEDEEETRPRVQTWKDSLFEELPRLKKSNLPADGLIQPFRRRVFLEFTAGPQAPKSLAIGYGPRIFGRDSLDFELIEPLAEDASFRIAAVNGNPVLQPLQPGVLINGVEGGDIELRHGDEIRLGSFAAMVVMKYD